MAVIETQELGSVRIAISKGMDGSKYVTKSKTLSNLKTDALAQSIYDVAEALANLTYNEGIEVYRQEKSVISI